MMKFSISPVGIGAAFAIMMSVVLAQESSEPCGGGGSREKFTPEAESAWQTSFEEIEKEIAELDAHPWAGTYYHGDGLGVNASLTLAPDSGFVFIWRGCLGVYDRNFGSVITTERGSLKLELTFENNRKGFQGVAEELVPVAWGERHYLIPLDGVVGFCSSVNSQREPRDGMYGFYYLRKGEHDKPADGAPELPEQYQGYLLSEPIQAEVVALEATIVEEGIGGWSFHKTKVTLNVGRAEKVLAGMSFRVYEPAKCFVIGNGARVLSVNEHTCDALINQPATDRITPSPPALGWKLTTGSPFGRLLSQLEKKENSPGE